MAFPTTPVIDNFNRADGNNIYSNGPWGNTSIWYEGYGDKSLIISSNTASTNGGAWGDVQTTASYTDVEAFLTISTASSNSYLEVMARIESTGNATNPNYYSFQYDRYENGNDNWKLFKCSGGSYTQLGSTWSHAPVSGEKFGISVIGDTITAWYYTGGSWTSVTSDTDTSYTSGYIGFELAGTTTIDDFSGGTPYAFPNQTTVLDDFNRADGNNIYSTGIWSPYSIWNGDTGLVISSNTATCGVSTSYGSVATTINTYQNCEAYATITSVPATSFSYEVQVRVYTAPEGGGPDYYSFNVDSSWTWYITRVRQDTADYTTIGSYNAGTNPSVGWRYGISIYGSEIKGYLDTGSGWVNVITVTDTNITGPGRIGFTLSQGSAIDNFTGGEIWATSSPTNVTSVFSGISSTETFGSPTVIGGLNQFSSATAINSAEAFGEIQSVNQIRVSKVGATRGTITTANANVTPTLPTGWAAGDIQVISIISRTNTNTWNTPPTGYTKIIDVTSSTTIRLTVWWRVVPSGATNLTFTYSGTSIHLWHSVVYRNVDKNNLKFNSASSTGSTSIGTGSITTTIGGDYILGFFGTGRGTTITEPGGLAEPGSNGTVYIRTGTTTSHITSMAGTLFSNATNTFSYTATAGASAANIGAVIGLEAIQNSNAPHISTSESFGSPTVVSSTGGTVDVATGIASAQAFGNPTIIGGATTSVTTAISSDETFGNQSITSHITDIASPISSSETFGTASTNTHVNDVVTGIASTQTFGSPNITSAVIDITTSISTTEAFGNSSITGITTDTAVSINSLESFGLSDVAGGVTNSLATTINSLEAFGNSNSLGGSVNTISSAILSGETFGNPNISTSVIDNMAGIPSAETFGNPSSVGGSITDSPTGINSGETFGSITINSTVTSIVSGIVSNEAFGNPNSAYQQFNPVVGIPSDEAFGSVTITPVVTDSITAVDSAETFGNPNIGAQTLVTISGISTAEQFGNPTITTGNTNVIVTAIDTAEAFGTPIVSNGQLIVNPTAINSGESFGNPVSSGGTVTDVVTAINSDEIFGNTSSLGGTITDVVTGISSLETFGNASSIAGVITSQVTAINSSEAFGNDTSYGTVTDSPTGISSAESFGNATISNGQLINSVQAINSTEAFGNPNSVGGTTIVVISSIPSGEAFGNPASSVAAIIQIVDGIASGEVFGSITTIPSGVIDTVTGIASNEAFGNTSITSSVTELIQSINSDEVVSNPIISPIVTTTIPAINNGEIFGTITVILPAIVNVVAAIVSAESFGTPSTFNDVATGMEYMEYTQSIPTSSNKSSDILTSSITNSIISSENNNVTKSEIVEV